jgi:hypothetical protein
VEEKMKVTTVKVKTKKGKTNMRLAINGKVCQEKAVVYLDGKLVGLCDSADSVQGWVKHFDPETWVVACLTFKQKQIDCGRWGKLKSVNPPVSQGYAKLKGWVEIVVNPSSKLLKSQKRADRLVSRKVKELFNLKGA